MVWIIKKAVISMGFCAIADNDVKKVEYMLRNLEKIKQGLELAQCFDTDD